jgi:hypothetical protein
VPKCGLERKAGISPFGPEKALHLDALTDHSPGLTAGNVERIYEEPQQERSAYGWLAAVPEYVSNYVHSAR